MYESHIDEGYEPKICTCCVLRNFSCVIRERIEQDAERCSFFSADVPDKPRRHTFSWPRAKGQRSFFPNGSVVTVTITMEEAR